MNTLETNGVSDNESDEFSVFGIDDVVTILKSDFENVYFVTVTYLYCLNETFLVYDYVHIWMYR